MRGIAAAAGLSLGSAYYYFQSKDDLVMAFYERSIDAMIPRMEAALSGANHFEGKVEVLMAVKFEYFQRSKIVDLIVLAEGGQGYGTSNEA